MFLRFSAIFLCLFSFAFILKAEEPSLEFENLETNSLFINSIIDSDSADPDVRVGSANRNYYRTTTHQNPIIQSKAIETNPQDSLKEFKREIETVDFVPKGQWILGLSVSYTQSSQDKYQFLILENITGDTYSFKISPMVMFTVKADLALGARFSYARSLTKVASADIILDSETDYSFDHLYRLSHNYYGALLMRNYFSIGRSKRFGFFNELQLQMGGGQTKLTTGLGQDLTGTYERNFSTNVGLAPGLAVFLSNYSALEVNVGLLGFNYTETKAIKDQIYVSNRNSKSANFRINLFSITFGVAFYL